MFMLTEFLPSSKTHRFWWGGVGWDVNVHWHFHKYVMLRLCPFFCNFHTYVMLCHCPFFCNFHTYVMLRWGGVGWDVNVHWHFHKYVMLRHCPFFCNFHTYVMLRQCPFFCNFHTYVMLRQCPFFCNFHTYVMLRHCPFFCNFHTYVMLRWGGVGWDGKVKPSSSETPIFASKLTFRYGETMNLC